MLLTKPLTTLLSTSLSPPLTTVLLLTPSGHILSSASTLPSSTLRARATLALQIWDLYATHPSTIPSALHQPPSPADAPPSAASSTSSSAPAPDLASIAVQLSAGILVIRALACGLLVCGLSSSPPQHADARPSSPRAHQQQRHMHFLHPSSPPPPLDGLASSAASDAGSVATTVGGARPGGRDVAVLRRRVEEVGKWLDGELRGFAISDGV